jgi:CheY-like chemotaxis protein
MASLGASGAVCWHCKSASGASLPRQFWLGYLGVCCKNRSKIISDCFFVRIKSAKPMYKVVQSVSDFLILLHPSHNEAQQSDLIQSLGSGQTFQILTEVGSVAANGASLLWIIDQSWSDEDIVQMLPQIRRSEFFPIIIEFRREVSADLTVAMIALDAFIRDRFLSVASRSEVSRRGQRVEDPSLAARAVVPSLRILLADDHETNRSLITRLVADLGHQCVAVENGALAVAAVQEQSFDLLLMDCQMPVLDGIDATRQIRGLEGKLSRLPIVAVTANHSPGLRQLCHSVGMNAFMSKPVDVDVLKRCIHELTRANSQTVVNELADLPRSDADIDSAHLNQVRELDGTGEFMVEMIEAFLAKLEPLVRDLEQKILAVEMPAVERAAHYLKSSAGNVGARSIWHILNQIEEYARAGNAAGMQTEFKKLPAVVRSTNDEFLNVWLSGFKGAA